jgi:hypothetical protein
MCVWEEVSDFRVLSKKNVRIYRLIRGIENNLYMFIDDVHTFIC